MKLKNYIKLLLTGLTLAACSSDPVDGPDQPGVTPPAESGVFTLFTRADNTSNTTGELTLPDGYGSAQTLQNNEIIHNWVVFFVNSSNSIAAVYSGNPGEATDAEDDYKFTVEVADGTYTLIAFANMEFATVKSLMDITDATDFAGCKDKNVDVATIKAKTFEIKNNGFTVAEEGKTTGDLIPMSGFREGVAITNNNETTSKYDYAQYHKHNQNKNVIEVIRMAAKVELKIRNSSSNPITITDVSFGILNKGNVPLFPTYSILGGQHHANGTDGTAPSISPISVTGLASLQGAAEVIHLGPEPTNTNGSVGTESLNSLHTSPFTLHPLRGAHRSGSSDSSNPYTINTVHLSDLASYAIKADGTEGGKTKIIATGDAVAQNIVKDYIFYVRESLAKVTHPASERFMITVKFKRGDNAKEEELHFSPTDQLEWINRNDHIIIPISITDVTVDWEVLFYPPIGGYPAEIDNKDEFNYYCEFGTQGEFIIVPTIIGSDGNPIAAKCVADVNTATEFPCYSMEIAKNKDGKIDIKEFDLSGAVKTGTIGADSKPTPTSIFTKLPTVNTTTGEILGELNSNTGRAIVPVTLKIKTSAANYDERTRNIYILRK